MTDVAVSVVIPTRNRAGYLDVVLASLAAQDGNIPHEVLVVDDASTDPTPAVIRRWPFRSLRHEQPRGLNAARNTGVGVARGSLIAFLDDDVQVPPGWLSALAQGAERHRWAEAFGGPIRARFEGPTPSSCGREKPPITTLDLGSSDHEVEMVWGANMAVRRSAFARNGMFDASISGHGDEEDWLLELRSAGGRIAYLAGAGVEHRRVGRDARLGSLAAAAYRRGRAARVTDQRRGRAPGVMRELRVVAGCAWHAVHFACPQGAIMGAHSAGRLTEAVRGRRTASR